MKRLLTIFFLSAAMYAQAQTAAPTTVITPPSSQPDANGIYKVNGSDISAPALIYGPKAKYTDEAKKKKVQGYVELLCVVDAHGNVQQLSVLKSLGFGLDESALAAAQTYKFKPAVNKTTGQPVPVRIVVEMGFVLKNWPF